MWSAKIDLGIKVSNLLSARPGKPCGLVTQKKDSSCNPHMLITAFHTVGTEQIFMGMNEYMKAIAIIEVYYKPNVMFS